MIGCRSYSLHSCGKEIKQRRKHEGPRSPLIIRLTMASMMQPRHGGRSRYCHYAPAGD
jgi:hypothetical protein